jgi:threonine dehydratase
MIAAFPVKNKPLPDAHLYLKLENLQISGSFKARGAVHKLKTLSPEQVARGLIAASGGNHGLGVAYAGWISHAPTTVYLAENVPQVKSDLLQGWGAKIVRVGQVFDDANAAALSAAAREGLAYLHPFDDPAVVAGQGTVGLEILEQLPNVDVLVVAIGGGGLIGGVGLAAKMIKPTIRIIGVEPVGAPTYHASREAGHPIELPVISTVVNTLAPRTAAQLNYDLIQQFVDQIVLVTDDEMREASRWLWSEMGVAAELAGSAAMAAVLLGRVPIDPGQKVCVLVCGAGLDGIR